MSSLNGVETICGDNINIPNASNMFATTKSKTIKGTYIIKPTSNAVFNSETKYAGATSQIVNSSGVCGAVFLVFYTKNAKSL